MYIAQLAVAVCSIEGGILHVNLRKGRGICMRDRDADMV